MSLFFKGLLIGVSIAAPVGPIGVLCIRRTLANGRFSGFLSGLGAATADACYASVAAFGLTFISGFLVRQQFWLGLIGGVFLCYLGIKTILVKPVSVDNLGKDQDFSLNQNEEIEGRGEKVVPLLNYRENKKDIDHRGLVSDYFSTFLLTLTNPMTILSFAAIFAGLGFANLDGNSKTAISLVLGVFLGSALWWFILSSLSNVFRARFLKPVGLRWVNWISGTIIIGFGVIALVSVVLSSLRWQF